MELHRGHPPGRNSCKAPESQQLEGALDLGRMEPRTFWNHPAGCIQPPWAGPSMPAGNKHTALKSQEATALKEGDPLSPGDSPSSRKPPGDSPSPGKPPAPALAVIPSEDGQEDLGAQNIPTMALSPCVTSLFGLQALFPGWEQSLAHTQLPVGFYSCRFCSVASDITRCWARVCSGGPGRMLSSALLDLLYGQAHKPGSKLRCLNGDPHLSEG